jgi:transposase
MENLCKRIPGYEYVRSLPGFGPILGSITMAAIGDPFRFNSGKQVLKLAGLDLSANRSGKNSDHMQSTISKKGKADLRFGLYQAAMIASTMNEHFINYFTNKLKAREREKGIKTKMRVKLSAKMLRIAWTLMKKKEKFNKSLLEDS